MNLGKLPVNSDKGNYLPKIWKQKWSVPLYLQRKHAIISLFNWEFVVGAPFSSGVISSQEPDD